MITCSTIDQMTLIIARLVELGLTFEANADILTITLTGGF